jgi:ATP-dependent DNA helicase PIF1
MTVHSFSGAPIWATSKSQLLEAVLKKKKTVKRWKKAKALVIDEISMIDGEFIDQLNYVANQLRPPWRGGLQFVRQPLERKWVWGGLQLVVTGDFFQLPPVKPQNPDKFFAFEADCWNECFGKQIELTHVFRQSDRKLVEMLQEIRKGLCNPTTLAKLNNCRRPSVTSGGSVTRLYPTNADVRRVNEERLKALGQEIITYR